MTLLFCNIGWMEHYNGQNKSDIITGGGSHVEKEGSGHEVCNFSIINKKLYGYVQPAGDQIRIERLGALIEDDEISDITVIWTASHPDGGTVIVGWYKNTTVYRYNTKFKSTPAIQSKTELMVIILLLHLILQNYFQLTKELLKSLEE
ncbi:MAG: hypothetical protein JKX92_15490 [Porticoccaceae bacterium]|nr:hypothetical protein [Porticoccaceae bacterium]